MEGFYIRLLIRLIGQTVRSLYFSSQILGSIDSAEFNCHQLNCLQVETADDAVYISVCWQH